MKRVVLSGYYGFGNTGDEAILSALIKGLKDQIADLELVVLSADPQFSRNLHQVRAVGRKNLRQLWQELSRADLLISGGGSLLQDVTGWQTVPYYLGVICLAKLARTEVFFLGQGVGPVKNSLGQKLIARLLNRLELITVRDKKSKELLKEWGVEREIELTADLVFSLTAPCVERDDLLAQLGVEGERPLLGISVRPWQDNSYLTPLAAGLNKLRAEQEVEILLIPFHKPADKRVSQYLAEQLRGEVHLAAGQYSPQEILALVGACDFFLGVRLHSLVFAALAEIPLAGISYDPKVDNFLARLGLAPVGSAAALEANRLAAQLLVLSEAEEIAWRRDLAELKRAADKNFRLVAERLGE